MEELRVARKGHVQAMRKAARLCGVELISDGCGRPKVVQFAELIQASAGPAESKAAAAACKAHVRANVELWHIPPRSPDLNPVERFWSWVRKRIRKMDLEDLNAGRPPLEKRAMQARVRALLKTRAAKKAARNFQLPQHMCDS